MRHHPSSGRLTTVLMVSLALAVVSAACGDREQGILTPNGVEMSEGPPLVAGCQASEDPDPNLPMCKLDGITVTVPGNNEPDTSEPPPAPPVAPLPPYTPGAGGFGKVWTFTDGDLEANAPVAPPGPYADGPIAYMACVLGAIAAGNLATVPEVEDAFRDYHFRLRRLNEAETWFQIARENRQDMGEELVIYYQEQRRRRQEEYSHARDAVLREINQWKSVSAAAFVAGALACTPALWIPYF